MESSALPEVHSSSRILLYRPFIFIGAIGLLLIIVGIRLLIFEKEPKVEFIEVTEASGSAQIKVDLAGAVHAPGLYTLPSNSRVHDVIEAGGGMNNEADQVWVAKNINLAAKVKDGAKIYIPNHSEEDGIFTGKKAGISREVVTLVNINSASRAELESLPGIGEVTAEKIISGRPYSDVSELGSKKIVGETTLEKIRELITY